MCTAWQICAAQSRGRGRRQSTVRRHLRGDPNPNQVRVKHNESFDVGGWLGGWFQTQDDVETKLYGLRPFESHGAPRNNSEAAERSMCAARTSTTHAPRTRHILRRGGRTRIYMHPV